MKLEEIIEKGKTIDLKPVTLFESLPDWYMLVVLLVLVITIFVLSSIGGANTATIFLRVVSFVMIMTVFTAVTISIDIKIRDNTEQSELNEYAKWVEESVEPFIEGLPKQKRELAYIKIKEHDNTNPDLGQTFMLAYNEEGNLKVLETALNIKMDLNKGDVPYFTYVVLEKDLGFSYNKGVHILEVHIPKDYKFTDIQ